MVGFEKALQEVKVIKDQIQYRSQSLFNLARDYFSRTKLTNAPSSIKTILLLQQIMVPFKNLKNDLVLGGDKLLGCSQ